MGFFSRELTRRSQNPPIRVRALANDYGERGMSRARKRNGELTREILTRGGWVRYVDSGWTNAEWWLIQQAMKNRL